MTREELDKLIEDTGVNAVNLLKELASIIDGDSKNIEIENPVIFDKLDRSEQIMFSKLYSDLINLKNTLVLYAKFFKNKEISK